MTSEINVESSPEKNAYPILGKEGEPSPYKNRGYEDYPEATFDRLKKYNLIAGILHGVQCLIQFILVGVIKDFKNFKLPVRAFFIKGIEVDEDNDGDTDFQYLDARSKNLGNLRLGVFVPLFFFLSSFFHFLVISPWFWDTYKRQINSGKNYFRWIEYSISSSLMIWIIAMLFGVYDLAFLLNIFGINAVMNLCGLMQERYNDVRNPNSKIDWIPFWVGCLAGILPWITIFMYISFANQSEMPNFVWGVFVSYLIFFNTFPFNMILQYLRKYDYEYGEWIYIVLSLGSKTLLAWVVFGGLNQPNKYT